MSGPLRPDLSREGLSGATRAGLRLAVMLNAAPAAARLRAGQMIAEACIGATLAGVPGAELLKIVEAVAEELHDGEIAKAKAEGRWPEALKPAASRPV